MIKKLLSPRVLGGLILVGAAAAAGSTFVYETLPGGVWHRNRLTGATCYIDFHCWRAGKDPFGKGLKLPDQPFGTVE